MFFAFFAKMFRDKRFLICFAVICALLLAVTAPIVFTIPILLPIPIIVALFLALGARAIWAGIASGASLATSGARIRKLAVEMPLYAEFEKRRSALISFRFVYFIAAIVVVAFVAIIMYRIGGFVAAVIVVAVLALVTLIGYQWAIRPRFHALRDEFKQFAVLEGLYQAFTNVKYEQHNLIGMREIDSLGLFKKYDSLTGNDFFEAERGGVIFCRSDLNLSIERRSEDDEGGYVSTLEKVFGGSVFRFNTGENYEVRLQAATVGFPHIRGTGGIGKLIGRSNDNRVETEMVEFNRIFNVYCEDQTAARVILTPQMIESLNRFARMIMHPVAFVFLGQYMYLLLSTPRVDSFEVCLKKDNSVREQQRMIMAQVSYIAGIVDSLYFRNRPVAGSGALAEPAQDTTTPARDTNLHVPALHGTIPVAGAQQEPPQVYWAPQGNEPPQGYAAAQGYATPQTTNVGRDAPGTPITPQAYETGQGVIDPGAFGRAQKETNAFFRFIFRYPRSIFLMFFIITCIIALFAAPYGMAIAFQDSSYIPVIPYMLVGGVFVAGFSFGGGKRGYASVTSWVGVSVLTLIHLLVFIGSI